MAHWLAAGVAIAYCVLLLPIAIAYCYCLLLLPNAIAYCYCVADSAIARATGGAPSTAPLCRATLFV